MRAGPQETAGLRPRVCEGVQTSIVQRCQEPRFCTKPYPLAGLHVRRLKNLAVAAPRAMRVGSEPTNWHQAPTTMQRQEKANTRAHAWSPDWLTMPKYTMTLFESVSFFALRALLLSLQKMGQWLREKKRAPAITTFGGRFFYRRKERSLIKALPHGKSRHRLSTWVCNVSNWPKIGSCGRIKMPTGTFARIGRCTCLSGHLPM